MVLAVDILTRFIARWVSDLWFGEDGGCLRFVEVGGGIAKIRVRG